MGIFRGFGDSGKASGAKTVIAHDCTVTGQVTLNGDLHLDGCLEGSVDASKISVGKQGLIKGNLRAKHIILAGKVNGQVECELLELLATCQLNGDISCHELVVEKGAKFFGTTKQSSLPVTIEALVVEPSVALLPKAISELVDSVRSKL